MKLYNKLLILALSCISLQTQSNILRVVIVNMYKKPVTININGQDVATLPTGASAPLKNWPVAQPEKIKIKAQGSLTYHNGIQEEYLYLHKLNQNQNPANQIAVITILDTNNILHFKYETKLNTQVPSRPSSAPQSPRGQSKLVSIGVRNDTQQAFTLHISNNPDVVVQPGKTAMICSNCGFDINTDLPAIGCSISFPGSGNVHTNILRTVHGLSAHLESNKKTKGLVTIKGTRTQDIGYQVIE